MKITDLQDKGVKKIYLIHESERTAEARQFANVLRKKGFEVCAAADYRLKGVKAVNECIEQCDLTLAVAFDDKFMKYLQESGVQFITPEDV